MALTMRSGSNSSRRRGEDPCEVRGGHPAGQVVLIGDTPRDVEAGKRSGSYVIGVATGKFDIAQLRAEGADRVFDDLCDTEALVSAVLAARSRPAA